MLDILEAYCAHRQLTHCRLDGRMKFEEREDAVCCVCAFYSLYFIVLFTDDIV
jgi:hypothetical protein